MDTSTPRVSQSVSQLARLRMIHYDITENQRPVCDIIALELAQQNVNSQ